MALTQWASLPWVKSNKDKIQWGAITRQCIKFNHISRC